MYYAKIENGQFVSRVNISDVVTDLTFTEEPTEDQLAPYGVVIVHTPESLPAHDPSTQGLVDATPTQSGDGKWYANYEIVVLAPVEEPPAPPSI